MDSAHAYEKVVSANSEYTPDSNTISTTPRTTCTDMAEKADNNAIEQSRPAVDDTESIDKTTAQGRDVDDAFRFAVDGSDVTWTEAEETKVRWKVDAVILPLVSLIVPCSSTVC